MLFVNRLIILPLAGAQAVMPVLAEPGQMLGRAGAAIGNQEQIVRQLQEVPQEMILLFDAGVTVAIAVEEMARDGNGAKIIDDGGQSELEHLVFAEVAARDVGGGTM